MFKNKSIIFNALAVSIIALCCVEVAYIYKKVANEQEVQQALKEKRHKLDKNYLLDLEIAWSPEVQLLIDWFAANENKLPTEPFALSACERVTNVVRFFTHIKNNIANVPNLISEGQLLAKLKKLQVVVK
jgi:hypothetical protein